MAVAFSKPAEIEPNPGLWFTSQCDSQFLPGVARWIAYASLLEQKRLLIWEPLFGIVFGAFVMLLPTFF